MAEEVPLTEGRSILIGFFSGSLLASAFASYGPIIQIFLFIIGLLVFVNLVFTLGEQVYIVSGALGAIIGIILTILFSISNLVLFYTIIIFIIIAIMYVHRFVKWRKNR